MARHLPCLRTENLRVHRLASPRISRSQMTLPSLCLGTILVVASCGGDVTAASACRNLVYKDFGLTRAEYLPCAGEIIAALDELGPQSEKALRGDERARAD